MKIAFVIKTEGLEYDDRLRKEIISILKFFPNIKIMIYAMLPENKVTEGITCYGVPYKSVYIPARDKYPSTKKKLLKAYQFYKAVEGELKSYDAIWVANVDAVFVPMLFNHKRILWDLHELPLLFMRNVFTRYLLRYILKRCKIVLHANPHRIEYMESLGVIENNQKHFALRNYPDFSDVDQECDEVFHSFLAWKKKRDCVYLQGLFVEGRAPYESIAAVLKNDGLVAVVVGRIHEKSLERLKREFGEQTIEQRVFLVGRISQQRIPQYMAECRISLIFYKYVSPNNLYCEANRFYQSVIMGLPVIVGYNPSMREIVNKYGFGISIEDDGGNIELISEAICKLLNKYDYYSNNIIKYKSCLSWEKQEPTINVIMNKLLE